MKKTILFLLFLAASQFFLPECSTAQLRQVYVDAQQADNNISRISFYSPSSGYVGFTYWVGYTQDSGRTFIKHYITTGNVNYNGYSVNLTFGFGIAGVKAFSADTLIVYGNYGFVPAILYSTDSGNQFTLVYQSQLNQGQLTSGITDIVFPQGKQIGYAVEADRIIRTTDGGRVWSAIYNDPGAFYIGLQGLDNTDLFAWSSGKLMRTTSGGASWTQATVPPGYQLNTAYFLNAQKGWINMQDNNGIYYTSDGAATWTQINNSQGSPLQTSRIQFFNDSLGYASTRAYDVVRTTDSGRTWQVFPRDNNYSYLGYGFSDLFFINNSQFWAGGGQGFLELTTNGGGIPILRSNFIADTTGVSQSNIVELIDYSGKGYTYSWSVNGNAVGNGYNASYTHDPRKQSDTITLIISNGISSNTSQQIIYFTVPDLPVITSFSPTTGSLATQVVISGTGLGDVTSVHFGAVAADSFVIRSATQIVAYVGPGASGNVSVTDPNGTAALAGFVYTSPPTAPPPMISGMTPASGPIGTTVILAGSNFNASAGSNIVHFGATRATVTTASTTSISCIVPIGASYEPVSVLNAANGLSGESARPFATAFGDTTNFTPTSFVESYELTTTSNYQFPLFVGAKDLDGDGRVDVIADDQGYGGDSLLVYRNTSTGGSLSFAPYQPILSNGNNGSGTFDLQDLDGDGLPDICAITNGQYFYIARNLSVPGTIKFTPWMGMDCTGVTADVKIVDIDGDGKRDIIIGTFGAGGGLLVTRNTSSPGNLSFGEPLNFYTNTTYTNSVNVGDVDGDGKPDVVTCNYPQSGGVASISVFRSTSTPGKISFATRQDIYPTGLGADMLNFKLVDVDGDGKLDIVGTGGGAYSIMMLNTSTPGNVSFADPVGMASGTGSASSCFVADLNGDAKPDFWGTGIDNSYFSITRNNSRPGMILFDGLTSLGPPSYYAASGDFDGDGKPDIVTSNAPVGTGFSIFRNTMPVSTIIPVTICANDTTHLTSDITGASYQWQLKKDSVFVPIANDSIFSGADSAVLHIQHVPASWNGYSFRCLVDGSYSKTFQLSVTTASLDPSVTIYTPDSVSCMGGPVSFTATTVNAGSGPLYQWTVNGNPAPGGTGSIYSSSQFNDSDRVQVTVTSNAGCLAAQKASSNIVTLKINPYVAPSVTISLSDTTAECAGTPLTFTATPVNGGTSPTFIWFVNGQVGPGVALGTSYTITTLTDGDQVGVRLISNAPCMIDHNPEANSTTITVRTKGGIAPSVSIMPSSNDICSNTPVAFMATASNGGANDSYQWYKDGMTVGVNSAEYADSGLNNGDIIKVILQTNAVCSDTSHPASDSVEITVHPITDPGITISGNNTVAQGRSSLIRATVTNAGSAPVYQWQDSTAAHGWQSLTATADTINYSPASSGDALRCLLSGNAPCSSTRPDTSQEILFIVEDSSVVTSPDTSSVRFFPNPVQSLLNVSGLRLTDGWESLEMITIEGVQKLYTTAVKGQTGISIMTGQLTAGVYVIILRGPKGNTAHFKIIKM
jgi:hypothetical protein